MGNLPKAVACAALAAACASCRTPQAAVVASTGPSELERIQQWEDRRSLGDGRLVRLAGAAPDPVIRARAFLALGRIQDAGTAGVIARGVGDPDPRVREMAAFAAGLLGLSWAPLPGEAQRLLAGRVAEAEQSEPDASVRRAELAALGRLATPEALERLGTRLALPESTLRAEAALGLGAAARRGAKVPEAVLGGLPALLRDPDASVRYGGAYALAASRAPAARPPLLDGLADSSAEVRALCARGLAETAQPEDVPRLAGALDDADSRVGAEATRTLARMVERCGEGPCAALDALGKLQEKVTRMEEEGDLVQAQPLLALAQQGLPERGAALLELLRARLGAAPARSEARLALEFSNLDCRFAAAQDRQAGVLANVLSCGGRMLPETRRISLGLRELSRSPAFAREGRWQRVARYLDHPDPAVRLAAVDALGANRSPEVAIRLRPLIGSPDLILAAAAASAAGTQGDVAAIPAIRALAAKVPQVPELAEPVAGALVALGAHVAEAELRGWLQAPHANVRINAAVALSKLTGQPVAVPTVEAAPPEHAPLPPEGARLTFRTAKGDFTVALDTVQTPLTSANLYGLARRGFFNGLTFHRVVPDFVVQGGDPRGDGEGGPDYTIRCEVGPRRYLRGTVGMALSGKDTGGSQFFVATSPQPHLEGRYTAFGEVVSGIEVIDRLLEGDAILEVQASP